MKDLWTIAEEITSQSQSQSSQQSQLSSHARSEVHVLLVGPKSCGKTTLVSRYMKKDMDVKPKPSIALEYTYGKKESQTVHFWEVGGGRGVAPLVDVVLTPERKHAVVAVLCVDLSKPSTVFSDVVFWANRLKLSTQGSQGMSVILCACKYDTFANAESEERRLMARTLRALALHYQASLVYASSDPTTHSKWRSIMTYHFFPSSSSSSAAAGVSEDASSSSVPSNVTDHGKPIVVIRGTDSSAAIGVPKAAASAAKLPPGEKSTGHAELDKWQSMFYDAFPYDAAAQPPTRDAFDDMLKGEFAEPMIDEARDRKAAEMSRVVKT
jgi:dynein light intermediate chain 2